MYKIISNKIIREFAPSFHSTNGYTHETEELPILEWVDKYRLIGRPETIFCPEEFINEREEYIIWLLCREEYMADRDLRLFAVWCAREAFKLLDNVDERSLRVVYMADKFAKGLATAEEMEEAQAAADLAVLSGTMFGEYIAKAAAGTAKAIAGDAAGAAREAAEDAAAGEAVERMAKLDILLNSKENAFMGYGPGAANPYEIGKEAREKVRSAQVDKLITYFLNY